MLRLILVFLVMSFAMDAAQAQVESAVYLNDGSVVRGVIIEEVPGQFVKIRLSDNRVLTYKAHQIMEIVRQPIPESVAPRKNPLLAGCLSGFLPGLGQFYNGESGKGTIQMGMALGGLSVALIGVLASAVETWNDWGTDSTDAPETIVGVGGVLFISAWVWSVIDAPSSAKKINNQNERQRQARLIEFHGIEVDPIASRKALGARFAYRF